MANKRFSVVIGSVNGRLSEVFGKVASLHAKQSFAFAIVAGNLFANPESTSESESEEVDKLLKGSIDIALPTYFSVSNSRLPVPILERLQSNDGELCTNLTALGRKVSIKTSEGFRIVALGGIHSTNRPASLGSFDNNYGDEDVAALSKDSTEVDLLITSDWPAAITDGSKIAHPRDRPEGALAIADLCSALKPRYHFSTSGAFYEREPFFHNGPTPKAITRFLSLAPFGNTEKQKWIYAFSLEPSAPAPAVLPQGCTASPLHNSKKRKLDSQQQSFNSFRYSNGNDHQSYNSARGSSKRHRQQPPPTADQCFFCLSNEACETHMIGAIGTDCYIAVAKGPLSTRTTFSQLDFPAHMLIIPLQHTPTLASIPDKSARHSTETELQRYRNALHDMLSSKSRDKDGRAQLGAVTWEISRNGGVHLHWQFLPVPLDLISRGLVEAAFDVEAENLQYPPFAKSSTAVAEAEEGGDYFKVMIWSERLRKEMVLPIDQSFRFDLQFGRKVLAKLLGLEGRVDWKACAQETGEEERDANAFKEAFKEFDFSLED